MAMRAISTETVAQKRECRATIKKLRHNKEPILTAGIQL
jgi:hypothetical protein